MRSKTLPLVFEIGCEEIPARFLFDAQKQLGERLNTALVEARLLPTGLSAPDVETYSTPRRLTAFVSKLVESQPDKAEEVIGPPARIAFDEYGKPTRAAESFAARNGVSIEDCVRVTTPKGEYLAIKKVARGRSAQELLPEILTGIIAGFAFPKSMYWTAKSGLRFVRPIRWIVAVLGHVKSGIPFEVAGVQSGNLTYGHRLNGRKGVTVNSFRQYGSALRKRRVEFDREKRREAIRHQLKVLLEEYRVGYIKNSELEEWIVNSTEWPHALLGSFEERFLKLPREVLITVMRDHQKYFAVESADGKLQAKFITVLNVDGDPKGLIRAGHERVLTARFSDAEFFWNADQKIPLRDRLPMLEKVTYQAKLGSYADKVRRMEAIAREVCAALEGADKPTSEQTAQVLRGVQLSKCDLTTQMVQEFTELQGVVGGLYAAAQGEPPEVADAIYDHYQPLNLGDQCPRSLVGGVVALADKLDTIIAGFSAGLEPTGSSDPFGLRRAGNGAVKIVVEKLGSLDLAHVLLALRDLPRTYLPADAACWGEVEQFLGERVEYYLSEAAGLRYDTVRAVVKSTLGWAKPADARLRGLALEEVRDSADFASLALAAKRTRNILTKSADVDYTAGRNSVRQDLFIDAHEHELFEAFETAWDTLLGLETQQQYQAAFRALAEMRTPIDRFFDHVLVMTEQPEIKLNRLRLLHSVNELIFRRLADLAEIVAPERADAGLSAPEEVTRAK